MDLLISTQYRTCNLIKPSTGPYGGTFIEVNVKGIHTLQSRPPKNDSFHVETYSLQMWPISDG